MVSKTKNPNVIISPLLLLFFVFVSFVCNRYGCYHSFLGVTGRARAEENEIPAPEYMIRGAGMNKKVYIKMCCIRTGGRLIRQPPGRIPAELHSEGQQCGKVWLFAYWLILSCYRCEVYFSLRKVLSSSNHLR